MRMTRVLSSLFVAAMNVLSRNGTAHRDVRDQTDKEDCSEWVMISSVVAGRKRGHSFICKGGKSSTRAP